MMHCRRTCVDMQTANWYADVIVVCEKGELVYGEAAGGCVVGEFAGAGAYEGAFLQLY